MRRDVRHLLSLLALVGALTSCWSAERYGGVWNSSGAVSGVEFPIARPTARCDDPGAIVAAMKTGRTWTDARKSLEAWLASHGLADRYVVQAAVNSSGAVTGLVVLVDPEDVAEDGARMTPPRWLRDANAWPSLSQMTLGEIVEGLFRSRERRARILVITVMAKLAETTSEPSDWKDLRDVSIRVPLGKAPDLMARGAGREVSLLVYDFESTPNSTMTPVDGAARPIDRAQLARNYVLDNCL